jgi:hypothetical protein
MGGLVGSTSWAGKIAGFFGKALPFLGKLVGFAFRWLPVVGWIWTIVDILNSMFGLFKSKESDPVKDLYKRQLYNQSLGKYFPSDRQAPVPYNSWEAAHGGRDNILQTLQINIDGKKAMEEQIQHKFEKDTSGQLNFNLIH